MNTIRALLVAAMPALACYASAGTTQAPERQVSIITVEVRAFTDGRDDLILQGNTLQWLHQDYTVPGLEGGQNYPTWITMTVDGKALLERCAWYPTWPGGPKYGSDLNEYSDLFAGLPRSVGRATLKRFQVMRARSSATLIQEPGAKNDYKTMVEFNDDPPFGADWYIVRMTYELRRPPAISRP